MQLVHSTRLDILAALVLFSLGACQDRYQQGHEDGYGVRQGAQLDA